MRRCKIAVGCKRKDKPCCVDCSYKTCQARCQNSPNRCNCCDEGPPPRRRERKVDSLQVAYLYGQVGLSPSGIAQRLGCSRSAVYSILSELGVPRHG